MNPVEMELARFMLWANMTFDGTFAIAVGERVASVGMGRLADPGEVSCESAPGDTCSQTIPSAARWLLTGGETDGRKSRP